MLLKSSRHLQDACACVACQSWFSVCEFGCASVTCPTLAYCAFLARRLKCYLSSATHCLLVYARVSACLRMLPIGRPRVAIYYGADILDSCRHIAPMSPSAARRSIALTAVTVIGVPVLILIAVFFFVLFLLTAVGGLPWETYPFFPMDAFVSSPRASLLGRTNKADARALVLVLLLSAILLSARHYIFLHIKSLASLLCASCVSLLVIAFPCCALPFDVVRGVLLCRAPGRVATQHPAVCCNFASLL